MFTFDCHAHVYETTDAIEGARYRPAHPAPLTNWQSHLLNNGLVGGVIVQVSFLGYDNSQLLSALQKLDRRRFAGVAVTPVTASEEELDALFAAGIRGIRWNMVRGAEIPDLQDRAVRTFLSRLTDRNMHLELHLESPRLAPLLSEVLKTGPDIVIDHFGLPSDPDPSQDPWINAVRKQRDLSKLFVKFSGHYRSPFDVTAHANALLELIGPDHIVWGSDWPHTQFEDVADFDSVSEIRNKWEMSCGTLSVTHLYGLS